MAKAHRRGFGRAAACIYLGLQLTAFSVAQTPATIAGGPPPSTAGFFPLSDVKPGMHATAWTVFEGTKPEAFGVDILGRLHNALGPGQDIILGRLTGTKAEYTGVVAGMSGSPVYIDGKLVGALSLRIGQFSKEPIAGITPIDEMLPVRDEKDEHAPGVPDMAPLPAHPDAEKMRPIDTPLVFSGFSSSAISLWNEHAPHLNMEAVSGLGGTQDATATAKPHDRLEPGSAVSALLVSGDMEVAATCTVTYIDAAGHMLACGHPLTQAGAVSMPMTTAEVIDTLASPAGSFKIVNTGVTVGAIDQDRETAIGGLVGERARTIPVEIVLHDGDQTRTLHLNVLDQAQLTPSAMMVSLFQALQETPNYSDQNSYAVHATVQISDYAPVKIDTLATPSDIGAGTIPAALLLAGRFSALYSSAQRREPITDVHIDVTVLSGRREVELNNVSAGRTSLHAGESVTLTATLAPFRGTERTVTIPVTLPASLPAGDVRLLISDGPSLDRLIGTVKAATTSPTFAGTVAALNTFHPDDTLYVTLLKPDAQVNVDGRVLQTVPVSVANLLSPLHERASFHSESTDTLATIPMHANFSGQQVITLKIE